jgi:uncharacterized protein
MSQNWSNDPSVAVSNDAGRQVFDEGLRIYMSKVYGYMSMGLLITAVTAYLGAASGLYQAIAATPLIYVVMFAPLGLVFFLSMRIHKMSSQSAQMTFWIYAGLVGLSLSYILLIFTGVSVVRTFLVTAASFGALSLYGYTTKRDLSGMGSFLFMGLIGIILASIVNIFLASSAMHFVISVLGVLIFAGLTAYDTQNIKQIYMGSDSRDVAEKKAIMGALRLYLDFLNMFLFLLQFMGNRD